MAKFLVTGGAGFIGSNIVQKLLTLGNKVVVIDNESSTSHPTFYWNNDAENYKLDICDYAKTRPLFNGVDYVLHLAAETQIQATILNPIKAVKTNTLGTATVLQCSSEAKVRRVVYSSTSAAYGLNPLPNKENQPDNCLNPYATSKVGGEKLCKMYSELFGLETIVLRYFNVYGPNQPTSGPYAPVMGVFKRQVTAGEALTIVGDGEQKRDFIHVLDVVDANILAATSDVSSDLFGTVFNIGSGENYSINDVAKMYSDKTTFLPARQGEVKASLADNQKARDTFGWSPENSLEHWETT